MPLHPQGRSAKLATRLLSIVAVGIFKVVGEPREGQVVLQASKGHARAIVGVHRGRAALDEFVGLFLGAVLAVSHGRVVQGQVAKLE